MRNLSEIDPAQRTRGISPTRAVVYFLALVFTGLAIWGCYFAIQCVEQPSVNIAWELPTEITGFTEKMTGRLNFEQDLLPGDLRVAQKSFTDSNGDVLECQLVTTGSEKASIRRPEDCLARLGWRVQAGSALPVKLADGRKLEVMRLFASPRSPASEKKEPDQKWIFMYLYLGINTTTPHYLQTLKMDLARLVGHPDPGWAYIMVGAPVLTDENRNGISAERIESVLADFLASLYPTIKEQVDARYTGG